MVQAEARCEPLTLDHHEQVACESIEGGSEGTVAVSGVGIFVPLASSRVSDHRIAAQSCQRHNRRTLLTHSHSHSHSHSPAASCKLHCKLPPPHTTPHSLRSAVPRCFFCARLTNPQRKKDDVTHSTRHRPLRIVLFRVTSISFPPMATATMAASTPPPESSYVAADMWSIFEESGLDELASSFIRPQSSHIRHSANTILHPVAASPDSLKPGASLLAALDDNASTITSTPSLLSPNFLISPFRSSPFNASPAFFRPPASRLTPSPFQPQSPLLGNYDSMHHSPSLRIMKQFQPSTSSSLSSYTPSPSRTAFSPLRSPLLPSAYLGSYGSYRAGKSAFEPQLYTSPIVVKQERMSPSSVMRIPLSSPTIPSPILERVDGLQSIEEDDITASSFPSLSSLSSMSSHSTAFSSVRSNDMGAVDGHGKSEYAFSSLSALLGSGSDSSASSLKRGRPAMPASPTSRTKRLKRTDSTVSTASSSTSPTPPPSSAKSDSQSQPRQQKGLRHFSLKVCEKVEQQGVTTYNNVADELVADLANEPFDDEDDDGDGGGESSSSKKKRVAYDEKNVRRRVYDALNVLTAMGIIVKEKKKITWIGLPGGVSQTVGKLAGEKKAREQRLREKRNHLQELLVYVVALKNLKQRNIAAITATAATPASPSTATSFTSATAASPTSNALSLQHDHIPLRFVLIKTDASHIVHLSVSPDQTELQCDVSGPFILHDESEVLKGMGLAYIDGFDLPYLIPREICSFYPDQWIRRGGSTAADVSRVDEAVGGRIGPGTVSLGGVKRK